MALHSGPDPPYSGVIIAMSDKSITLDVVAGIITCPFYMRKHPRLFLTGRVPSQPVARAGEVSFPPISQPSKHVG